MIKYTEMAIDSGQTAIKVRLGKNEGQSFSGLRANDNVLRQIAAVVGAVAKQSVRKPFRVLVGTCGMTKHYNDPEELLRLCRSYGVQSVVLTHDAVTSFIGAVGDREGVVVAAGTGAITLGVGHATTARVDGWGNIIGDASGGFWIGREALDAVHRAYDGRGPATALTPVIQRRFPDLESAYIDLQTDVDWVRVVASFAREVVWLAEKDAVSGAICRQAGDHLAQSAATAVERIGHAGVPNPLISLVGGILLPGAVRDSCVAALQTRWPAFVPFPANGSSLDGAQALGSLDPSHPLSSLVASASLTPAL